MQNFLCQFRQKIWSTRYSIITDKNCQSSPSRNSPPLQKSTTRCKQVWIDWEFLRCVAHSLFFGMTMAIFDLLGRSIVRIQCVRVNFAGSKNIFWNFWQKRLSMSSMQVHVWSAQYSLRRTNKFIFFEVWPRDLFFWIDTKLNSRCYWRYLLSWNVFFKTEVCLCPFIEEERWRLLRLCAMQSVGPCFENSFWGPTIYNYVV